MSAGKKQQRLLQIAYTPAVLLEPCPTCAAPPGNRCTREYSAHLIKAGPHTQRIQASKKKDVPHSHGTRW